MSLAGVSASVCHAQAGLRVEAADVEIGQALDDRLDGHRLETDLRSLGQGRGGEPKRLAAQLQTLLVGAITLSVSRRDPTPAREAREAAISLLASAARG
jgi:hypothetical protein